MAITNPVTLRKIQTEVAGVTGTKTFRVCQNEALDKEFFTTSNPINKMSSWVGYENIGTLELYLTFKSPLVWETGPVTAIDGMILIVSNNQGPTIWAAFSSFKIVEYIDNGVIVKYNTKIKAESLNTKSIGLSLTTFTQNKQYKVNTGTFFIERVGPFQHPTEFPLSISGIFGSKYKLNMEFTITSVSS